MVDFGKQNQNQGAEICKCRPCVVISLDRIGALPLKVVVPLTSWKQTFEGKPWLCRVEPNAANGLRHVSAADSLQVKSVSTDRFKSRIGVVSAELLEEIIAGVQLVIGAS